MRARGAISAGQMEIVKCILHFSFCFSHFHLQGDPPTAFVVARCSCCPVAVWADEAGGAGGASGAGGAATATTCAYTDWSGVLTLHMPNEGDSECGPHTHIQLICARTYFNKIKMPKSSRRKCLSSGCTLANFQKKKQKKCRVTSVSATTAAEYH